ncbi:hypothetical protein G6F16_012088 [Rhizopus arrhizus]|nr:hypothetical protein G6F24_010169 [Rhizopus arrhizus]KAG0782550.1 hypothetical protein G6F22_009053 [Rhizopus arrhizus]KAG0805305.1 hypothetical protein G6F20_012012 [Rhizopus arrhizus]KAG0825939.1 hypothetical protein G6F18_010193 [Rhizopus arrhizus]KAG0837498.1 hypothetical protein G6F19_003658 [Rhizopus arrhizus]
MESILDTAKYIFTKNDPNNNELYDCDFLTNNQIYKILSFNFPRLQHIYSLHQFSLLLNKHKDHFGVQTQKKVSRNKLPVRGRSLYVLKKNIQEDLNVNKKCFKKHIQNSDGEWINIGYVRKSPADESGETRDILVRKMVSKLINIGFCEKIYVSPCSSTQYPIFKRDFEIEHKYGDGNTQDFLRYLSICSKKICVCIISYAGLTTNTEDLQKFLRNSGTQGFEERRDTLEIRL